MNYQGTSCTDAIARQPNQPTTASPPPLHRLLQDESNPRIRLAFAFVTIRVLMEGRKGRTGTSRVIAIEECDWDPPS